MSRCRTRARRRRARSEESLAEFARVRHDPQALCALLKRLADDDTPVWPLAQAAAGDAPLSEEERAMIGQIVAPELAGMTPGSVKRRHEM